MDENGLIPDLLGAKIAALQTAGKNIKFLYTIPNFNNPSGITLAESRRQEMVDICRKANILILEDNPYGLLLFTGRPLAPLRAANPDDVIYMGSFSKIFAPGSEDRLGPGAGAPAAPLLSGIRGSGPLPADPEPDAGFGLPA